MNAAPTYLGFADLARDAQASFRATMDAMARPGTIKTTPVPVNAPQPLNPTMAMLALTLCDFDSPIWLDDNITQSEAAKSFIAFHTSAPVTKDKATAQFALLTSPASIGNLSEFAQGTDEYPDRSTTLIIQVGAISNSPFVTLSGPGIETTASLSVEGLDETFWSQAQRNSQLFPRGVDFIFVSDTQLCCLPRSTKISLTREAA